MQEEIFQGLKAIPFLAEFPDEVLIEFAQHAKKSQFPKNTIIISEGDETNSLYILLSGKVRVFSSELDGKEITLSIQKPISYFGELALLSTEPRSASVITTEHCVCAIISKSDFKNWLGHHPDVAIRLIHDLSNKVRQLTDKIKQLALMTVYERTIQTLYDMAESEGELKVIHNRPTQQELANMVGSSREMINKIMKELTKGDYISISGKTLTIERKLPESW